MRSASSRKVASNVGLILFVVAVCTGARAQVGGQGAQDCSQLPAIQRRLSWAEARLKDWPQLDRYKDANGKLPPPAKGESRVVFMGDSITDIWKLDQYFPGKPYVNRGIGGQTTPQMLVRFRPDVIALDPKVVVILAGTNDIAGNTGPETLEMIEDNLASMCELARAHGIKIVLASLTPVSDYEHDRDGRTINQTKNRPPEKINELNRWIKHYADENKLTYLDYFSATVDDKGFLKADISGDGLHPNAKGFQIMAPLAERAIEAALK